MEASATVQTPSNAKEKSALDRSSIRFPYLDLDDAVEIAKKVFEVGGNSCDKIALAANLNVSAEGGGFNQRLGTAKMFGLITGEKKLISLTDLGKRVVTPESEKSARSESFLAIGLYKALYDDYEGQILPSNDALEAHILKLGVAAKQKDKARQVFQRSAKQAGYFANNRFVAPQFKQGSVETTTPTPEKDKENNGNGGNGGGGNDGKRRHPFIEGLLETLPPASLGAPKTEWSLKDRQDWLQTAAGIFNLIYSAKADDKGSAN